MKFSSCNVKDTNATTYTSVIYDDQLSIEEQGLVTFLRVYAEEIMEKAEPTLAAAYGFLFKAVQMPKASKTLAGQMIDRLFRIVKEGLERRSIGMSADVRLEPEDTITLSYPGMVGASQIIVNDITLTQELGKLEMSFSTRKFIS